MKLAVVVVCAVAMLGCSKKAERKKKAGATCAEAAQHMFEIPLKAEGRDLSKLSDDKRRGLDRVAMAFTDRCLVDHWSQEAIECFAGAETADDLGACKGTLTEAQEKPLANLGSEALAGNYQLQDPTFRAQVAKSEVEREIKVLLASYRTWKKKHTDCPHGSTKDDAAEGPARNLGLMEIQMANIDKPITQDSWGSLYRLYCGDALPEGATEFAVSSDGPDKTQGTADDLKSW